jgi:hypothetical protein
MPLTRSSLTINTQWSLENPETGYATTKQADKHTYSLTPAVVTFDQVYSKIHTIVASDDLEIDLFDAFTNLVGESVTAVKVCSIEISVTGDDGGCKFEPGAADALTWFLSGTSPAITIPVGGAMVFAQATAETIDATHRNILLTNTSATDPIDVKITFILGDS